MVTCQQYHRQLLEMTRCNKATPTIQEVAAAMGISLVEATQHQSYIDDIIREAREELEMDLYANADIPAATVVYHRHLLTIARCNQATPTIQEVAAAMGISEARATQLQSYLDDIIREARDDYLKFEALTR